jgi:lipoprotein NlpI
MFVAGCWRCWLAIVALGGLLDASVVFGETADELVDRAVAAANRGERDQAILLATQAIQLDPTHAAAFKIRGREFFCASRIFESIADFDRFVELTPRLEALQWERGIAYYYAGKYQQGAQQFEKYQTVDGHDVENSVWRFLCMVPEVGVARAQAVMLPIEHDRRIPMMQVFDLYRGQRQPEEVLAAARAGNPDATTLAGRLFYAHLYLGLWWDAQGKREEARRYIDLAADDTLKSNPRINRYMWEVARIHQKLQRGELQGVQPRHSKSEPRNK